MEQPFITIAEAGKRYFGVSRDTATGMARRGEIPTVKVGRRLKVPVAEMNARYPSVAAREESAQDALLELVTRNISVIEFALLGLANSANIGHHIGMEKSDIARLADSLREAYERCAS